MTIDKRGRITYSDLRYMKHQPVDQSVATIYRSGLDGMALVFATNQRGTHIT